MLLVVSAAAAAAGCDRSEPTGVAGTVAEPPTASVLPSALPAPRPTQPLGPNVACITAECHPRIAAAAHVHPTVRDGDCLVCHEPDQGHHTYPLTRPGDATCTICHDVVGNLEHQHAADEVAGCTTCHDPHASPAQFLLTSPSVEILCQSCHVAHEGAVRHGPMAGGQCTACHLPHESESRGLLRGGDGPRHCFLCHAETQRAITEASHVHAPAAADCTTCHDPHASDHAHALRLPIDEACFACHEDLQGQVASAATPHGAVFTADRCANCHDAHASDRPALLRDRQDVLCLECHDRPIVTSGGRTIGDMMPAIRERRFRHGPVRSGDCTACHSVHGASHERLLREHFPGEFYASFAVENYALCFSCHDSALVTEPRTTTLTGFRDGDVNLHFVHVNRERKGRTCRACHEIHGSNLPRHLSEAVLFEGSSWAMPLAFTPTTTGGSCAPGCHRPMSYQRGAP